MCIVPQINKDDYYHYYYYCDSERGERDMKVIHSPLGLKLMCRQHSKNTDTQTDNNTTKNKKWTIKDSKR